MAIAIAHGACPVLHLVEPSGHELGHKTAAVGLHDFWQHRWLVGRDQMLFTVTDQVCPAHFL